MLALGYSISGFIGPLCAGFGIDHFGFAETFALLAVVPFVPLAALASGQLALPGAHPQAVDAHRGGVRALMRHRTLRRVLAINALFAVGWDLHTVFVPIYGERIGLTASAIGLVLATFAAATFVVRLLMPMIARRVTEHRVLAAALFVAGAVYLAFPFWRTARRRCSLCRSASGSGSAPASRWSWRCCTRMRRRGGMGEAAGVRMSLVNSMAVAVPLVFGALGASVGLAPVFWSVGACLATGGFLARRAAHT